MATNDRPLIVPPEVAKQVEAYRHDPHGGDDVKDVTDGFPPEVAEKLTPITHPAAGKTFSE